MGSPGRKNRPPRSRQCLWLAAILLVLGWSNGFAKAKPAAMTVKDFPLGVGSQWVYLHIDSVSYGRQHEGREDRVEAETVKVAVVGQAKLKDGHTAGVWIREFKNKADTQYVGSFGDTVCFFARYRIYTDTLLPLREEEICRFVFPLRVAGSWRGPFPGDAFKVTRTDSMAAPPAGVRKGFWVERNIGSVGNALIKENYLAIPGIGLARMKKLNMSSLVFERKVEIWKLINCEIKK